MKTNEQFEEFLTDLQEVHDLTIKSHNKWNDVISKMVVTDEEQQRLRGVWDQNEAWYSDKIDIDVA
jgi:hypothetical protein